MMNVRVSCNLLLLISMRCVSELEFYDLYFIDESESGNDLFLCFFNDFLIGK